MKLQSKRYACSPKNGVVLNARVSVTIFDEIRKRVIIDDVKSVKAFVVYILG